MASIYPNRKNGKIVSFKFKAYLGRDENGKQISKCTTWIPEKTSTESKLTALAQKEATIWERDLLSALAAEKEAISPEKISFKDFVETKWFPAEVNNDGHRNSTIAFRRYLLLVIVDYLGDFPLKSIDSTKIEEYLNYLKNTYRTTQNKQLSQQTIKHHYGTLNLIFDYAVKLNYVSVNPLVKVKTPKLTKHKVDALSKGEVLVFIREVEKLPQKQRLMYTLLLTTGIRRGECFGLQWRDIDETNALIHIKRNVTYTAKCGIQVGLPKTELGRRVIPLTTKTLDLIKQYQQAEQAHGEISNNAFLFHSSKSFYKPQEPTYITKHMRRFMERSGLPAMSPHDLRHTCASLLLQSGADIKSVQDILGHADASTTLNFYVRSDMDAMRGATNKAFQFD